MSTDFLAAVETIWLGLIRAAWQAGLLAGVVLLLTWVMGSRLQPRWRFALWSVVFLRLAMPVLPAAPWSAFGLVADIAPAPDGRQLESAAEPPAAHFPAGTSTGGFADSPLMAEVATPGPPAPQAPAVPRMRLAAGLWLTGVLALVARSAGSFWQLYRRQRNWQPISDAQILAVLQACASELKISRPVSLWSTPDGWGPATCGIFRPRIVLPEGLTGCLSLAELRLVLLHELVHICRWDVLVDRLVGLVTILHWFHPVAWISRYFLRRERELACDAAVLRSMPAAAGDYGRAILKTVEIARCATPLPGFVGILGRRSPSLLHRRIGLIAGYRPPTRTQSLVGLALLAVFALAGLTDAQTKPIPPAGPIAAAEPAFKQPTTPAQAKPPEPAKPETPAGRIVPTTVAGRALDELGRPLAGATVYLALVNSSPNKVVAQAETDASGRYEFHEAPLVTNGGTGDFLEDVFFQVFGQARDKAIAWRGMKEVNFDPRYEANPQLRRRSGYMPGQRVELDLTFQPARPIAGRFVDERGRPIAGVSVALMNCRRMNSRTRDEDFDLEGPKFAREVMAELMHATSDQDGKFELAHTPPDVNAMLWIRHADYAHLSVHTSTAASPPDNDDRNTPLARLPLSLTLHSVRSVPIVVKLADTGRPLADQGVSAYQEARSGVSAFGKTDAEGKLTLKLPPGKYRLGATPSATTQYVAARVEFEVTEAAEQREVALSVPRGGVVVARAIDADSGAPIAGVAFWQQEMTYPAGSLPGKRYLELHPSVTSYPVTDELGEVRAILTPGPRRIGLGKSGITLPAGYAEDDRADMRAGRELNIESGQTVTLEFKLRKKS